MARSQKQVFTLAFALGQLALVGWVDYATTYDVSVAILYYCPIAYAAWHLGWGWSFGFGLLCAATLTWLDQIGGHAYSQEWIRWEVAGMRLLGFLFVAFSFNFFKRALDREQEKVRRLEGALTFCNCCSRVRDEAGNWSELRTLVRASPALQARAKVCPECARATYAGAGERRAEG